MEKKMMKSNGAGSRSSAMKRRRLLSAAAVLLAVCLVFVGAAGATGDAAEHVAKNINSGETYPSIQEAINYAASGDTITVTKSHELDLDDVHQVTAKGQSGDTQRRVFISVVNDKDIIIDLNGCRVSVDFDGYDGNEIYSIIGVVNGAKLTLVDNSESKTGKLYVGNSFNKLRNMLANFNEVDNNGWEDICSLVIDGGSYVIETGTTNSGYHGALVYARNNATTWVKNGTFTMGNIGEGSGGNRWIFVTEWSEGNRIVVTGGTFNADINHQHYEYEVYVPENLAVSKTIDAKGESWWTVVPAVASVTEYQSGYSGKYTRNVGYATIEDAVKAANTYGDTHPQDKKHETITLLEDVELEDTLEFTKSTIFNMDSHKLIWKGGVNDNILTVSGNNNKLTINSFDIIREGYTITKWKLDGTDYTTLPVNENGPVEVTHSLSIAEPPKPNTYFVAFEANGAESGTMGKQKFTYDEAQTLTPNAFTKTGYTFTGWKTDPNGSESVYTDEHSVKNLTTINEGTVTLYANWTANKYTVTFAAGEGTVSESTKEVTFDQSYGVLPTPIREGHEFVGWYLGDSLITADTPVTVDDAHTLTAHWEIIEIPEDDDIPEEEEIITSPSSGGGGDGGALSFPRTTENGGLVDFGSSKVVKAVYLPEGSSGSVLLKVDTVEKWPKALDTEYTFDISVEKLGDGMAYIHFEIPESTLESLELTPADICAYHFEGEVWTKLPTTYEVKDGTVCYEAETDSFSPFKLVIEEGAATQKEEENVPTVPPTEEPDVPDEPEILPPIDEPAKPTEPETPAPILAVLAGLGAAFIVRRK